MKHSRRHARRCSYICSYFFPKSVVKLGSGGGGIRTHEGLRPAGFQDRSHQPLDHPSEVGAAGDFATTAEMSNRDQATGVME